MNTWQKAIQNTTGGKKFSIKTDKLFPHFHMESK